MAAITESALWTDDVYRIEENDPVEGGEAGVDNRPHKDLANRTLWLKQQVETNNQAISNETTARQQAITEEQQARNANFQENSQAIADEATARASADSLLNQAISNEVTARANADTELANLISGISLAIIPSGAGMWWPTTAPPLGFVEAAGQSTSAYPELAAIYGPSLPDMRGEFPRGWDNGRGIDTGRSILSSQNATRISNIVRDTYLVEVVDGEASTTSTKGANQNANSVNVTATYRSVRPRNIAWMFIIKT